jgi:hypothetical protein
MRPDLLVEAGPDPRPRLPEDLRDGQHSARQFERGYMSDLDELGVAQKVRRAKVLGGTGWLTRFAPRGAPADYNEWRDLGNPGWASTTCRPTSGDLNMIWTSAASPGMGTAVRYPSRAIASSSRRKLELMRKTISCAPAKDDSWQDAERA